MCLDCAGSSPSQMIAVCWEREGRCRSMQLYAALSAPSSNHLMETSPGPNEQFLILVGAFDQLRRLAASAQNPFGSLRDRSYISLYLPGSMKARFFHSGGTS